MLPIVNRSEKQSVRELLPAFTLLSSVNPLDDKRIGQQEHGRVQGRLVAGTPTRTQARDEGDNFEKDFGWREVGL